MNETMRREILAQPDEVERAIPILRRAIAALELESHEGVVTSGCGDSFYASQVAAGFFASGAMNYSAATALDVCSYRSLRRGDLHVFVSISGNTRRTAEAAVVAKHTAARTLAVTCAAQSALAQVCDATLLLPFAPLSRRTPHTLDYTMTVIALAIIAEALSGREFRWLADLPSAIAAAIDRSRGNCMAILSRSSESSRWFFLGGGPGVGIASYGAAKFHEAGGLLAWGAELENFMHGMNFMVEPDDRVFLVGHDAASRQLSRSVAKSLNAMGIRPWFVLPDGGIKASPEGGIADEVAASVTCAIPLQVLCLEHANRIGLDLEAPRAGRQSGEIYLNAQKMYLAG